MNKKSLHETLTSTLAFVEEGITIAQREPERLENQQLFILAKSSGLDVPFVWGYRYPDQVREGQSSVHAFRLQRENDHTGIRRMRRDEAVHEAAYASAVSGFPESSIQVMSLAEFYRLELAARVAVEKHIHELLAKLGPQ